MNILARMWQYVIMKFRKSLQPMWKWDPSHILVEFNDLFIAYCRGIWLNHLKIKWRWDGKTGCNSMYYIKTKLIFWDGLKTRNTRHSYGDFKFCHKGNLFKSNQCIMLLCTYITGSPRHLSPARAASFHAVDAVPKVASKSSSQSSSPSRSPHSSPRINKGKLQGDATMETPPGTPPVIHKDHGNVNDFTGAQNSSSPIQKLAA